MYPFFRILLAVIWLASAAGAAPPIFLLKDVRPGLKGECRTVFTGVKIQAFQFEVAGVARNFAGPGRDIIWCKMTSDPTGQNVIAAGMSGSPCFVEGRNMGAVAFGWAFNKDPIFGVQPIESMLEVLDFKGNEPVSGIFGQADSQTPSRAHGASGRPQDDERISGTSGYEKRSFEKIPMLKSLAGFGRMLPLTSREADPQMLPLPVEVTGLHPLISERVNRGLTEAGFWPLKAGGGGLSAAADRAELEPGSALTGVIARGDLNIAATGTLTWRDGNRILAFGHPFLRAGAVNIPMGKAEIVATVSSYMSSFKISNKGNVVGTLTQDRMSGVGGVIGLEPKFTPMVVRIKRPGRTREFKLEFCDNKFFTPLVYQTALLQFLSLMMENTEEATLRIRSEIEFDGLPALRLEDVYAGEHFEWVMESVITASMQLLPIYHNEFGTPAIRRITVNAEIQPVVHSAALEEIVVEPVEAHPGDTLRIRAGFQPWHGKRFYREYSVKLPEEVKGGEVTLTLADAEHANRIDGSSRSSSFFNMFFFSRISDSSRPSPRDLKQLIETLNERHRRDRLYLFLRKKSEGLHLQNQRLTALPGSVRNLLSDDQTANSPPRIHDAILSKIAVDFDSVIEGSRGARIQIK